MAAIRSKEFHPEFKDRYSVCKVRKYYFDDPCKDCVYFPCMDIKSQSQSNQTKEREVQHDGIIKNQEPAGTEDGSKV